MHTITNRLLYGFEKRVRTLDRASLRSVVQSSVRIDHTTVQRLVLKLVRSSELPKSIHKGRSQSFPVRVNASSHQSPLTNGYYRLIDSITLVGRKSSQEMKYNHPTAQIWMARSEAAKVNPRPIIKEPRAPASQSTMSSKHPSLVALDTEYNTPKVLLFCETSIFSIIGKIWWILYIDAHLMDDDSYK